MQVLSFGFVLLGHFLPYFYSAEMAEMIDKLWFVCKLLALANIDLALAWLLLSQLIGLVVSVIGGGKNE